MVKEGPSSGAAILAAAIPTFLIACLYIAIFVGVRNRFKKFYVPRAFLGTISPQHRTPASHAEGTGWFQFKTLSDRFILQHNSLDAYLYLRFLKFIVWICLLGCCLIWPILLPINAAGGGDRRQLDKLTIGNVTRKDLLWAHVVIAWVFLGCTFIAIAWERLELIGIRQACFVTDSHAARISAKTVLFLNVPRQALEPESLKQTFGGHAERSWPVRNPGDLEKLVQDRNAAAMTLESAQYDFIVAAVKHSKKKSRNATNEAGQEEQTTVPRSRRPTKRTTPVIGTKVDAVEHDRESVVELTKQVEELRSAPDQKLPGQSAVFVLFDSQGAAHRAFQQITFQPRLPLEDRFLAVQPKEVLWSNLARPVSERLSKASLALAFVIAFTIFFSIPVGLIGTLSNVEKLADRVEWLSFLEDLPPSVLGLLTGLVPPFLTSWFVSYVPKLFRHIAKLSGEPTTAQAELKTQAWFFVFQVTQVFLVTTISSGTAAVVTKIMQDPSSAPALLAANLPSSANFYLTYFLLQGLTNAASNVLNYSDLLEYLFYEYYWDKTPREQFTTFAQMKGTPWAAWWPKFTNLFVIAIVYSCIAPLVLGFATVGIFLYYLSYRYSLLYVRQTKIDTKGEAYKRALQHMPTALYFAELCLIGLFAAQKAPAQTGLMIALLVLTAVANLTLDRMLRPLELYLGVDKWQEQEVPLLAEEDGIDPNDEAALHAASHGRRLGLNRLPKPAPRWFSDFFDGIISVSRTKARAWLDVEGVEDEATQLSEDEMAKLYLAPAFTSKVPKLWIPSDGVGASKEQIAENEAAGLPTTDESAEIDEDGKLHWDHDFEHVPVFSKPKVI